MDGPAPKPFQPLPAGGAAPPIIWPMPRGKLAVWNFAQLPANKWPKPVQRPEASPPGGAIPEGRAIGWNCPNKEQIFLSCCFSCPWPLVHLQRPDDALRLHGNGRGIQRGGQKKKKERSIPWSQTYHSGDSTQKDPSQRCSLDTGVDGTARRDEEFWVMSVASAHCCRYGLKSQAVLARIRRRLMLIIHSWGLWNREIGQAGGHLMDLIDYTTASAKRAPMPSKSARISYAICHSL